MREHLSQRIVFFWLFAAALSIFLSCSPLLSYENPRAGMWKTYNGCTRDQCQRWSGTCQSQCMNKPPKEGSKVCIDQCLDKQRECNRACRGADAAKAHRGSVTY